MANTLAHASSERERFKTLTWAGTGGGHLFRCTGFLTVRDWRGPPSVRAAALVARGEQTLTREVGCALLG